MPNYKFCLVPMCKSTTVKTPGKIFVAVPKDEAVRNKWCTAMKRDKKLNAKLSARSSVYVCGDHFDLPSDMDNYMHYTMMGGHLRVKKGVSPHIFDCQKSYANQITHASQKRKRMHLVENLINPQSSTSQNSALIKTLNEDCSERVSLEVDKKKEELEIDSFSDIHSHKTSKKLRKQSRKDDEVEHFKSKVDSKKKKQRSSKNPRPSITEAVQELNDEVLSVPYQSVQKLDNECDIIGKHIAIQLQKLPTKARFMANIDIQHILMKYRLENLFQMSEQEYSFSNSTDI